MAERFFVAPPILGEQALLDGPEAHHLIHVMRARPGLRVVLFDGSGAEFAAEVRQVRRTEVELAILARDEIDRELPIRVILAVALPKGDRQKWLVEKAVELGVGRIVPLRTSRCVAQPVRQALARLRRTVIEASKQCGRNRLLELVEPENWDDFVAATGDLPCRLVAHASGHGRETEAFFRGDPLTVTPHPDSVVLAVGPEGGFAPDEIALATAAGWSPIDLGPRTLRVETAAVLLMAMVFQRLRTA